MPAAGTTASTRTDLDFHPTKSHWLILSMAVLVLGIYSYPALKTSMSTGNRMLPAMTAPDVSLYLNISNIGPALSGQAVEPYYGMPVPVARMGYLKFRTAFRLFHSLSGFLHGDLWWSLLLWNSFWCALAYGIAWWLFEQFLPQPSPGIVVAGLALLMFFNFGVLQSLVAAWRHLPSLRGFESVEFPLIRSFFPQVPIPLLLLYLGLQMKALQKRSWRIWAAMAATQFLAFTIFPYAMLMMAGITAVAVLSHAIFTSDSQPWKVISLYATACGLIDILFFLHGGASARSGTPGQSSLVHFQMSVLAHRIGGMWMILAALTLAVAFTRNIPREIKWPLVGLGASNLFLLVGDAFFSETAIQMSHHGGYFVHPTAVILLVFTASSLCAPYPNAKLGWRFATAAFIALLVFNGVCIAAGTYRAFLPGNEEQAELVRLLQSDPPAAGDLVIARSLTVDDDCAWVPLLSTSHVLFCRNAQVLLTPEQNEHTQRFRQALYLYFTNKDHRWVEDVLNDPAAVTELTRLMFLGQVTTDAIDRKTGVDSVRNDLIPLMLKVENGDPDVRAFFSGYRHVLVIDSVAKPFFTDARLSPYLKIEDRRIAGNLRILKCTPIAR
jgi:hypothetical protein